VVRNCWFVLLMLEELNEGKLDHPIFGLYSGGLNAPESSLNIFARL
jgi:hypothetical protein